VWHSYCDWYLEISQCSLLSGKQTHSARYTLLSVLEQLLCIAHPFMPFITEEIWQHTRAPLKIKQDSIMVSRYPRSQKELINHDATKCVEKLMELVNSVRVIRGEFALPYARKLKVLLRPKNSKGRAMWEDVLEEHASIVMDLAGLESIQWLKGEAPVVATQIISGAEVLLPIAGLVNKIEEENRLNREIDRLNKEIAAYTRKLGMPEFIDKAPAQVVSDVKARQTTAKDALQSLDRQRVLIASLEE
jgi:valyl-tRNA synthetase